MIYLFLDTNILIDLLANRKPFAQWAYRIFQDQKSGKYKLTTSSSSVLTCYYIIEKQVGSKQAKKAIKVLLSKIEIEPIDKLILEKGLMIQFKDYEDAVQHECAVSHREIDYIITRNKRDFKNSMIPVVSSEELYISE